MYHQGLSNIHPTNLLYTTLSIAHKLCFNYRNVKGRPSKQLLATSYEFVTVTTSVNNWIAIIIDSYSGTWNWAYANSGSNHIPQKIKETFHQDTHSKFSMNIIKPYNITYGYFNLGLFNIYHNI